MKWTLVVGTALIIAGSVWAIFEKSHEGLVWIPSCTGNGGRWGPPEYYDSFGCPNGWYHVNGGWQTNDKVLFPLCPSSGTRLHGTWNTTVFLNNFDGEVRVENGVIVEKR